MKSLGPKLISYVLVTLLAGYIGTGALVLRSEREMLEQDLKHDGVALASTIAGMCIEPILTADASVIDTHIRTVVDTNRQIRSIEVIAADGETLTSYGDLVREDELSKRVYTRPVSVTLDDGSEEAIGSVRIAVDSGRYERLTQASLERLLVGGAISFVLLALVLSIVLKQRVLRRIQILDRQVSEYSDDGLEHAVELEGDDELSRLAATVNTMRVQLKQSYDRIQAQCEELRHLDVLKDELLANTSHELKTPLNGILGLTEILLEEDYDQRPDQREAIEDIRACGERLLDMTLSILTFSRLKQSPRSESRTREHNLGDHLRECLVDLAAVAQIRGVVLRVDVPDDFTAQYRRSELETIVRILVDNALKYTEEGGVEVLAVRWPGPDRPGFQLAVRDTGVGIPAERRHRVFEPFIRGQSDHRRSGGGIGLGLSIATKTAATMPALLELESEVGEGTCCTLLVPELREGESPASVLETVSAARVPWPGRPSFATTDGEEPAPEPGREDRAPQAAEANPSHEFPRPRRAVLVVDDEAVNRHVLERILRGKYSVKSVESGEEALRVLHSRPVDVLLLDLMMPGLSGFDVIDRIRADGDLLDTRIIVVSAKGSVDSAVRALQSGAADYVHKPVRPKELIARVETQVTFLEQRDRLAREIEQRNSALEVAQHACAVKSQFLDNMSHEIRTPLNGIVGFAQLLESTELSPDQAQYLHELTRSAADLLDLIEMILDVSRIESRGLDVRYVEACPIRLLRTIAEEHAERAKSSEVGVQIRLSPASRRSYWLPESTIRVALDHVVENAVRFGKGQDVSIAAAVVESTDNGDAELHVEIADSGIGIPEEDHRRIFEPFFQVDSSDTRAYGGAGLGLTLARSALRAVQGTITVESAPDEGSTFRLVVPVLAAPPEQTDTTVQATTSIATSSS